jgi:hypothetical protein
VVELSVGFGLLLVPEGQEGEGGSGDTGASLQEGTLSLDTLSLFLGLMLSGPLCVSLSLSLQSPYSIYITFGVFLAFYLQVSYCLVGIFSCFLSLGLYLFLRPSPLPLSLPVLLPPPYFLPLFLYLLPYFSLFFSPHSVLFASPSSPFLLLSLPSSQPSIFHSHPVPPLIQADPTFSMHSR